MENKRFKKQKSFNKNNSSERQARNTSDVQIEQDESVISGRNAVKELLASGRDIEKIYVQQGEREGSVKLLIGLAAERKIQISEVSKQKLDQISSGAKHQGIVAVASEAEYSSVEDILAYAESLGESPFLVVCDGIEDPHNLGAIIRSAECSGAHGVIIPKRRAAGLTSTVGKASAGALMHMRVARVTNIAQTIDELKAAGVWTYAADMGDTPYYKSDMKGSVAIVLGNEGAGISRLVKEKCDFTVSIPLYGKIDSLNVSCAAAVLLSEAARQRNLKE